MTQSTDLYSILKYYAEKIRSPYIDATAFINFLKIYAARQVKEQPEWYRWTRNTASQFWTEIRPLMESGQCEFLSATNSERLYMPHYYIEMVQQAYESPDTTAMLPFPSENSLKIHFSDEEIQIIDLDHDLPLYLKKKEEPSENSPQILRLLFPDEYGSALILSSMIPRQLLETALIKVRGYLHSQGNKEYVLHKLTLRLQGKEGYLRDILNQLLVRPLDCLTKLEEGGENSSYFWVCFCSMVKNDIKKKSEFLTEDLAMLQTVCLLEACNSFYQIQSIKKREREVALKNLDLQLDKPPFLYSLEAITKFTSPKGVLLMGQYSPADLDAYIKSKTIPAADQKMPELLIISGKNSERWYIKRDKLIPYCLQLCNAARPKIRGTLDKRWGKFIREYRREPAMDKDEEFEKLLKFYIENLTPILAAVLRSNWLYLVYAETIRDREDDIPESYQFFINDKLVPYANLLLLNRKEILTDIRMLLPFWYSIPFFVALISFTQGFTKKPMAGKYSRDEPNEAPERGAAGPSPQDRDPGRELRNMAKKLEGDLVPSRYTLDTYLAELESRWGRLLNKQGRQELVTDVNVLIRDRLRQTLRLQKRLKLTQETLKEIAETMIFSTPSLKSLSGQDSLRTYIMLYLIKHLQNEPISKM
ncbi:MAG: hypothetical protein LBT95_01990 [Treponema sp.]|jgi:hypothetical protein|nr:hypothetical protein [Treponema sp.]